MTDSQLPYGDTSILLKRRLAFITYMSKKSLKTRTRLKIVGATVTAVFSLASCFVGTMAWFASNSSVEATGMSISVKAEQGVQFDLYYLDHFAIDQSTTKDGNYDSVISAYAGYEIAAANPVFNPVTYEDDEVVLNSTVHNLNPMDINHLWPAHRLTYAIVVTEGSLASFTLDTWDEVRDPTVLTQVNDEDVEVSLSWAINMYGGAYYVTETNSVTDDIATGFASYVSDNSLTDKFTYSQTNIAPVSKPAITILNSISGASGDNKRVILYFSIEFSDDNSTYYSYSNPYYVKDTLGNSNCYESLSLTDLSFALA